MYSFRMFKKKSKVLDLCRSTIPISERNANLNAVNTYIFIDSDKVICTSHNASIKFYLFTDFRRSSKINFMILDMAPLLYVQIFGCNNNSGKICLIEKYFPVFL